MTTMPCRSKYKVLLYMWRPLSHFMIIRFTIESTKARDLCRNRASQLMKNLEKHGLGTECHEMLLSAIEAYFDSPLATSSPPLARDIDYDDFSLANIVYAGIAKG